MVEFGIRLPAGGPLSSPQAMAVIARAAEDLGYDALWVHDFIVWTSLQDRTHVSTGALEVVEKAGDAPPIFYESLTNLAYLAALTNRVRLGVAVLCLPYREPILMAKQIANVDLLSDGRLILGIGVGGAKTGNNKDFEVLGISRADKWERSKDYFRAMVAIWTQDKPSYDGAYVHFPETDINPKPVQKPYPPTWGSGRLAKSMDVTAELATGWLPSWITAQDYPAKVDELRQMARAKGREVDWTVGDEIYACIAPTSQEARAKSDHTMEVLTEGFGSNPPTEEIRAASLVGSPGELVDKIGAFAEAGVHHFELKFIYHSIADYVGQLELFRDRVMTHFGHQERGG